MVEARLNGHDRLKKYFDLQAKYDGLYSSYLLRGVSRQLDPLDKEFAGDSPWHLEHYFEVGADALRIIVKALVGNLREPPLRILDLPCGSGRVTRHLRRFFPDARIVACDLYESHVNFCEKHFGVDGRISHENLDLVDFDQQFDLIFCGSLLTHLPEEHFISAIRLIERAMTDSGIAIVTLQGRHSEFIQANMWKYIDDERFGVALSTVPATGFGYVDYDHEFGSVFHRQARYGVALARPRWTMAVLEKSADTRILGYTERDWDQHQDVVVFGRPAINHRD